MKREIKFRAWDDYKMIHFSLSDLHGSDIGELRADQYCECEDLTSIVSSKTIMQFTGLKDKNGKEIYEGDIIKWPIGYNDYATLTMYIGYNELGMRLYKRLPCMCCGGHKGGSIPSFGVFKKCEVIGNIYENAELLNK